MDCICASWKRLCNLRFNRSVTKPRVIKQWHLIFQAREEEGIVGLIHAFRNVVDDGHDIGTSLLLCNNFPGQLPAFTLNVAERRIAAFRHLT